MSSFGEAEALARRLRLGPGKPAERRRRSTGLSRSGANEGHGGLRRDRSFAIGSSRVARRLIPTLGHRCGLSIALRWPFLFLFIAFGN